MNNENYKLFVYGSLRSGFKNPVYQYLSKYVSLICEASIKGKLYNLGNYPVGIATTDEKFIVSELYSIKTPLKFSWVIGQHEDYEGLNTEEGEKSLYKRQEVIVYQNTNAYLAWAYWFNRDISGNPEIESDDLLQYQQQKNKF